MNYLQKQYYLPIAFLCGVVVFLIIKSLFLIIEYFYESSKFNKKKGPIKIGNNYKSHKTYNDIDFGYDNLFRNRISCLKKCNSLPDCKAISIYEDRSRGTMNCDVYRYDKINKPTIKKSNKKHKNNIIFYKK